MYMYSSVYFEDMAKGKKEKGPFHQRQFHGFLNLVESFPDTALFEGYLAVMHFHL